MLECATPIPPAWHEEQLSVRAREALAAESWTRGLSWPLENVPGFVQERIPRLAHGSKPTHDRFQLAQYTFSPRCPLINASRANEERISECFAQPVQRSAHRGLA